jgi:hypothetical protein
MSGLSLQFNNPVSNPLHGVKPDAVLNINGASHPQSEAALGQALEGVRTTTSVPKPSSDVFWRADHQAPQLVHCPRPLLHYLLASASGNPKRLSTSRTARRGQSTHG